MYNILGLLFFLTLSQTGTTGTQQSAHLKGHSEAKAPGTRQRVDFESFVRLVLARSGAMKSLSGDVMKAQSLSDAADALRWPTVKISLMGAPSHKYVCVVPDAWNTPEARGGMSEEEFRRKFCVGTDRDDTFTLQLDGYVVRFEAQASVPLYTFGRIDDYRKAARHLGDSALSTVSAARMQARVLAAKLYFSRKLALETRSVLSEGEKLLDRFQERFDRLDGAGRLKPSDRFRFRLGALDVRRAVSQAESTLKTTRKLMDVYAGQGVEADRSPLSAVSRTPLAPLERLEAVMLAANPQIVALRQALVAARFRLSAEKKAWYPQVGLFVRYRYTTSNSEDPENAYLNDGLHGNSVSGALVVRSTFDWSRMRMAEGQARAQVVSLEGRLTAKRQELISRLGAVYSEITRLLEQIRLTSKALKVARAWVAVIKEKDDTGAPYDPKDAVAAVKAYFQYRLERLVLYYRLAVKREELAALVGSSVN